MDRRSSQRRLVAILFTDIMGYTALMAASEERGLRARERHRALVRPLVERYHGEPIEARGDESLSVFPSALAAVNCALAIQERLEDEPELRLHIGIHLGDVVMQAGEVSGDGVNIAARICSLSEGDAAYVSAEVQQAVRNQPNLEVTSWGEHQLKNVGRPVSVFRIGGSPQPPAAVSAGWPSGRRRSGRWGALAAAVAVLVALGVWSLYRPVDLGPIRSLAVLPLENLSGDPEQQFFTDGMTEAVIANLARLASLSVVSRTSVMQYRGTRKALPEIARELGVGAIIEGSVLRAGDNVRITVQLIDARTDRHLWSESYERPQREVLRLQSEVARAIARQVQMELVPADEETDAAPVDPVAYENFLRAMYFMDSLTPAEHERASRYFREAIRADPEYAPAWAGLSFAQT
ncbi:MAG: adenylate/guanylate cyclase domain-containing protein [Myxococcota bacterium]